MIRLAVENLHEVEPIEIDEAFRRTLHLRKAITPTRAGRTLQVSWLSSRISNRAKTRTGYFTCGRRNRGMT
jgi:hypothetical protein